MAINIRGIRQSATIVNALTIGKLLPLVAFIVLGLPHVAFGNLDPTLSASWTQISTAALALIFAYGGYEVIPVPAGEARDPKKIVPVRDDRDDRHRGDRHDAGASRRDRHASRPRLVEDAAGGRGVRVHRRRGAR